MENLYLISLIVAFLSVLPVAVLVMLSCRRKERRIHIISSRSYKSIEELEQSVRELWWETRFNGETNADTVILLKSGGKETDRLCKRLKREFPQLVIKKETKFIRKLRSETNGRKKANKA